MNKFKWKYKEIIYKINKIYLKLIVIKILKIIRFKKIINNQEFNQKILDIKIKLFIKKNDTNNLLIT